jgi:hypothetical protein
MMLQLPSWHRVTPAHPPAWPKLEVNEAKRRIFNLDTNVGRRSNFLRHVHDLTGLFTPGAGDGTLAVCA